MPSGPAARWATWSTRLRVAVTGQGVGPGLYDCLAILGRDVCRARIRQTLEMLQQPSTT